MKVSGNLEQSSYIACRNIAHISLILCLRSSNIFVKYLVFPIHLILLKTLQYSLYLFTISGLGLFNFYSM